MTHESIPHYKELQNDFGLIVQESGGLFKLRDFVDLAGSHLGLTREDCEPFLAAKLFAGEIEQKILGAECWVRVL